MPQLLAATFMEDSEGEGSQPHERIPTFFVGIVIRRGISKRIATQRRRLKRPEQIDYQGEVRKRRLATGKLPVQLMPQFKCLQPELDVTQLPWSGLLTPELRTIFAEIGAFLLCLSDSQNPSWFT